ncbi:cadherin-23-like [Glandiceps talaboti]
METNNEQRCYTLYHTMLLVFTFLCVISKAEGNSPPSFDEIPGTNPQKYYDMDKERLDEDRIVGSYLYTLKASDPEGDCIDFSIIEDDSHFKIDNQNCTDAIDKDKHDVTWRLDDGHNSAVETAIKVYVLDVNDNEPKFDKTSYVNDIYENKPIGTTVLSISVTDRDPGTNGEFTLSITNDDELKGMFYLKRESMDAEEAYIILNGTLDYETAIIYQVHMMAKDHGTKPGSLNSTSSAYINVRDVQDSPPYFLSLPYFSEINENANVNTSVCDVYALDGDRGVPQEIEFFIYDVNCSFWVQTVSNGVGVIRTSEVLNRELLSIYLQTFTLTINILSRLDGIMFSKAKEIDSNNQSIEDITVNTTVSIEVKDINDEAPTFESQLYQGSVQENSPRDIAVDHIEMIVEDKDTGDGGRFALTILDVESAGVFHITPPKALNRAYAIIRVRENVELDYEEKQQYSFQVLAFETHSTEYFNHTTNVVINITDMNDNYPIFDKDTYTSTIDEHSPNGTFVVRLNATDADSGTYGKVAYELQGGAEDLFYVDPDSGNVTVTNSKGLDREDTTNDRFTIIAAAFDDGQRTSTSKIIVNVNDINDHDPVFGNDEYEGFIKENTIKTQILKVQATDEDIDENGHIEYFIVSVSPFQAEEVFVLDNKTGSLGVKSYLDFEALPKEVNGTYILVVMAQDNGAIPRNDTTIVKINVEGVNDNDPRFEQKIYSANITEEFKEDDFVITLHASDDDVPHEPYLFDTIFDFRIVSGSNKFSVRPTNGRYNDTETSYTNISISPGQQDMDVDRYGAYYELILHATDRGSPQNSDEATLHIYVEDINNKPPSFVDKSKITHMAEGTYEPECSSLVATMNANDPDKGNELLYEITGIKATNESGDDVTGKDFQFCISPSNGSVYVNESLDREEVEIFHLDIFVKDRNAASHLPDQNDTATLEVRVTDVNDNRPVFVISDSCVSYYCGTIPEENRDVIYTDVRAIDPDKGNNGIVEYYINETDHFQINKLTGVISIKHVIDREVSDQLNITVLAKDKGEPSLSNDVLVYFDITDINDNEPEFVNLPNNITIYENATIGSTVFIVSAIDADVDNHAVIEYSINSAGNTAGAFNIDKTTGVVYVNNDLDREILETYDLTITATDNPSQSPNLKTSAVLTVQLLDVNDNPPRFTTLEYSTETREDEIVNTNIISVTATDEDLIETDITYSIGDRNDSTPHGYLFKIEPGTNDGVQIGVVKVNRSLTSQHGFYFLELIATDSGKLSSSASLIIEVFDINDNAPVFISVKIGDSTINLNGNTTVRVHVTEDTSDYSGSSRHLCTVHAKDDDKGQNGNITYTFREDVDPSFNYFDVAKVSGDISIKGGHTIDREVIEKYPLYILATDNGVPNQLSAELALQVIVDDIDDNEPTFQRDKDGMPIPDILDIIEEHDYDGQSIGNVTKADDLDIGDNAVNYYFIIAGDEFGRFTLDKVSRRIYVNDAVIDREDISIYNLVVKADPSPDWNGIQKTIISNDDTTDWTDTTLHLVTINVIDINDNGPIFKKTDYTTGVTTETTRNSAVTTVEAIDADEGVNAVVMYEIISETCKVEQGFRGCGGTFRFDNPLDGIVYNAKQFEAVWTGYFDLLIKASDIGNHTDTTHLSIYLLREDQRLKFKVDDDLNNVVAWVDDFIAELENILGARCNADTIVVNENAQPTVPISLDKHEGSLRQQYKVIEINRAVPHTTALDNLKYVVMVMGIVIFALVLFVLILAGCHYIMRRKYKTKLRAERAGAFDVGDFKPNQENGVPGTNRFKSEGSNPLWNNAEANIYADQGEPDKNSLDENEVGPEINEEEQEFTIDFNNDDYDIYKIPPNYTGPEDMLTAVIGEHDRAKQAKFGIDIGEMDVTAV